MKKLMLVGSLLFSFSLKPAAQFAAAPTQNTSTSQLATNIANVLKLKKKLRHLIVHGQGDKVEWHAKFLWRATFGREPSQEESEALCAALREVAEGECGLKDDPLGYMTACFLVAFHMLC
jgi:hypothetical protein